MKRAGRNDLLTAIRNRLLEHPNDPFVKGITGKDGEMRYYLYEVPQEEKPKFPYAVSTVISEVDIGEISSGINDFEWQMSIFGERIVEANDLADHCHGLFGKTRLSSGPICFSCRYAATVGGIRDVDTDPWMVAVTFKVYG